MTRFAAELLFVFLRSKGGQDVSARKVVERKIINLTAADAEDAFHLAMQYGQEEEFQIEQSSIEIKYEFLGITELISLEDETEEAVWCHYQEMVNPQDRRNALIPSKGELSVFKPSNRPSNKMKILRSR